MKKLSNLNNFFDYIRLIQMYDATLYDHIKSLIPSRIKDILLHILLEKRIFSIEYK